MTFQTTVQRSYTTGFPGDIVRDGPKRAKTARLNSVTLNADGVTTNHFSRAYGYIGPVPATGTTYAADVALVDVGGPNFYGVMGNPKHNALGGTASGGPLAASLDLPQGTEAEFFDMVTGMVVELFNTGTSAQNVTFGFQVGYVPEGVPGADNPNNLPLGALIAVAPGAAAPTGLQLIPNARVMEDVTIPPSAAGAPANAWTIIQLTQ